MPPKPPQKPAPERRPTPPAAPPRPPQQTQRPPQPTQRPPGRPTLAPVPPIMPAPNASGDMSLGVAVAGGGGETVTARKAGGLRDMSLDVDPDSVGISAAMQHLAKAVNIAFQTDYGENYLESVYQAAIVRNGEVRVVHREYFGFGTTWLGQFGMLLKSLQLSTQGSDPASPEGSKRFAEKGPATIRGLLNIVGRKLDLLPEFEDRVPAYVEQMFDRLEASGIIVGWDRQDWKVTTTRVGLDIRITPTLKGMQEEVPGEG